MSLTKDLFDLFCKEIENLGLIVNQGKIVDASFVEASRERNGREKNQQIKEGKDDELWNDAPSKKAQKNIDAR